MITVDLLKQWLDYNPETGKFKWRRRAGGVATVGVIAGTITYHGYRLIKFNGTEYPAHKLAWFWVHGEYPKELDHKNRNRDDNRIDNLRLATRSQNAANRRITQNHSTGIKGVSVKNNRWRATITLHGKKMFLGSFKTPEEAQRAYITKAKELFGEFASAT